MPSSSYLSISISFFPPLTLRKPLQALFEMDFSYGGGSEESGSRGESLLQCNIPTLSCQSFLICGFYAEVLLSAAEAGGARIRRAVVHCTRTYDAKCRLSYTSSEEQLHLLSAYLSLAEGTQAGDWWKPASDSKTTLLTAIATEGAQRKCRHRRDLPDRPEFHWVSCMTLFFLFCVC